MITRLVCLILALGTGCARGRGDLPPGVVVAIGETPEVSLRAGDSLTVSIPVLVADGFHVQSNPASSEFYIPLELDLEPSVDLHFGKPIYPKGEPHYLEGSPDTLLTNEGRILICLTLGASPTSVPGRHLVKGALRYQACDSSRCLFPATIPITLFVVVVP